MSMYQRLINTPEHELVELIKEKGSISGVVRHFGFKRVDSRSRSHIKMIINKYNLEKEASLYLSCRHEYTKEILIQATSSAICMADVMKNLNLPYHGANHKTIYKLIDKYDISLSHFDLKKARSRKQVQNYQPVDVLCVNSTYTRSLLARFLRKHKLLEYKCETCGNIGNWLGQQMNLCIDHKNGINNDNRLENLRYMCYNCHSLTDTFAGKNKNKRK